MNFYLVREHKKNHLPEASCEARPGDFFPLQEERLWDHLMWKPSTQYSLTTEDWLAMFRTMVRIRYFEERVAQIYTQGKIGGFCHLCIGQESISACLAKAMEPQDTLVTAYRAHGHAIALGMDLYGAMAELMGKAGGCSAGKGGSMHMFLPQKGFYGGHGIVGAQVPIGTGMAFAHQYQKDAGVCLTLLGDGASNQGQFFEAMNMAALWNLPVLYIIENNGYAMGTSVERACAGGPLYQRGFPFGIKGACVSGDSCHNLYSFLKGMLQEVRQTSRPMVLEIDTYRFKGHSMSDPGKYRTREALDQARIQRDAISLLKQWLLDQNQITLNQLEDIENTARKEVQEVWDRAEADIEPSREVLFQDVVMKVES